MRNNSHKTISDKPSTMELQGIEDTNLPSPSSLNPLSRNSPQPQLLAFDFNPLYLNLPVLVSPTPSASNIQPSPHSSRMKI